MNKVAARLRLMRGLRAMDKSHLAVKSGVSSMQIGRIETGETASPGIQVLGALCKGLGDDVRVEFILEGRNPPADLVALMVEGG